ncbi:unnamed protein product [Amoebophrya sp. A120]|nr:unnamed protein product [Amoebophrya sp. A120]|eukprot:GSA120T00000056001.1
MRRQGTTSSSSGGAGDRDPSSHLFQDNGKEVVYNRTSNGAGQHPHSTGTAGRTTNHTYNINNANGAGQLQEGPQLQSAPGTSGSDRSQGTTTGPGYNTTCYAVNKRATSTINQDLELEQYNFDHSLIGAIANFGTGSRTANSGNSASSSHVVDIGGIIPPPHEVVETAPNCDYSRNFYPGTIVNESDLFYNDAAAAHEDPSAPHQQEIFQFTAFQDYMVTTTRPKSSKNGVSFSSTHTEGFHRMPLKFSAASFKAAAEKAGPFEGSAAEAKAKAEAAEKEAATKAGGGEAAAAPAVVPKAAKTAPAGFGLMKAKAAAGTEAGTTAAETAAAAAAPKAAAAPAAGDGAAVKPKGLGGLLGKKAAPAALATPETSPAGVVENKAASKVTFDVADTKGGDNGTASADSSTTNTPKPKGLGGLFGKKATAISPEAGAAANGDAATAPAAGGEDNGTTTPKAASSPLLGGLGKAKSPGAGLGGLLGGKAGGPAGDAANGAAPKTPGAGLGGLLGGKPKSGTGGLSMTQLMMAKKTAAKVKEKAKRLREEKMAHLKALPPLQKPNPIERKKKMRDPDARASMTPIQRFVTTKGFDGSIGLAIALNVLFMGFEYQLSEKDVESDDIQILILVTDLFFLAIFTGELAARVTAFGWRLMFSELTYILDVVVVFTGLISEIIMPIAAGTFMQLSTSNSPVLNLVRSMRALRALRVLRVLTMFEQLWHVVELFFFSLTPLAWAVGFILVVIFLFAIFSIVLIGRASMGDSPEVVTAQQDFYTTSEALITLFSIMTLDGWTTSTKPLFSEYTWTYFWFLFFISISAFSLMNLITVTVLETARAQQVLVQTNTEIDLKTQEIADLLDFPGEEEQTTKEYFIENWHKNRALRLLFEKLHLNAADATGFFEALDIDGSGGLDHFELATTYMELVSSVMHAPHNIALIRSACDPAEKSKLLKSTMLQSQQGRFVAEFREARADEKQFQDKQDADLAAERQKAQSDRNLMRQELESMRKEMTELKELIKDLKDAGPPVMPVNLQKLIRESDTGNEGTNDLLDLTIDSVPAGGQTGAAVVASPKKSPAGKKKSPGGTPKKKPKTAGKKKKSKGNNGGATDGGATSGKDSDDEK